jgi:hypothetical protein
VNEMIFFIQALIESLESGNFTNLVKFMFLLRKLDEDDREILMQRLYDRLIENQIESNGYEENLEYDETNSVKVNFENSYKNNLDSNYHVDHHHNRLSSYQDNDYKGDMEKEKYHKYKQFTSSMEVKNRACKFCTLAGKEYLIKVLTFYRSIIRNNQNAKVWICCMDNEVYQAFKKLNLINLIAFKLQDFETEELRKARKGRTDSEYCWTLKGSLIEYIMDEYKVDSILYCDSDLFFFSDPIAIFDEWGNDSVFLCPQRDLPRIEKDYGTYQAGLVGFKNDEHGREALTWWKRKCIEWCFYKVEEVEERWADQKYLDKFPKLFKNVKISNNLGVNAAPWNIIYNNDYKVQLSDENIYVEKDKLVAFHFALFTVFNKDEYDIWNISTLEMNSIFKKYFYARYVDEIRESIDILRKNINGVDDYIFSKDSKEKVKNFYVHNDIRKEMNEYDKFYTFCSIASKDYVIKVLTLYKSLNRRIDNFRLFICCTDEISYNVLKKISPKRITLIPVYEIEKETPLLINIKKDRNMKEYCWTLKSPVIKYVMDHFGIQSVMYLDADLYFFDKPDKIFDEWKDYSILMCTQRGSYELESNHGHYQAGLLGFRRDGYGIPCLSWWKGKCLDWCFDRIDKNNNRWGDQKYLEEWPYEFKAIKVVKDLGIDAAPWNTAFYNNFTIENKNNEVYVNKDKLILYHFGSLDIFPNNEFDLWKLHPVVFNRKLIEYIYNPYLQDIIQTIATLRRKGINTNELIFSKTIPENLYKLPYRKH